MSKLIKRNSPCPCGSGKKYKNCCLSKTNLMNNDYSELDFSNVSTFRGIRVYLILKSGEMINSINSGKINDTKIVQTAKLLDSFAEDPKEAYNNYIVKNMLLSQNSKFTMSDKDWSDSKLSINTTERALIKSLSNSILFGLLEKHSIENFDYGATKAILQLIYQTLFTGLTERKILTLMMYVANEDELSYFHVNYDNSGSCYDIKKHNVIFPLWNNLQKNNNKHMYVDFEDFDHEFFDLKDKTSDQMNVLKNSTNFLTNTNPSFLTEVERNIIGTYVRITDIDSVRQGIVRSPYDGTLGINYFLLGNFFKIKEHFMRSESNMDLLDFLLKDIIDLTEIDSFDDCKIIKARYSIVLDEVVEAENSDLAPTSVHSINSLTAILSIEAAKNREISDILMIALKSINEITINIVQAYINLLENIQPVYNYKLILALIEVCMDILGNYGIYYDATVLRPLINININKTGELIKFDISKHTMIEEHTEDRLISPIVEISNFKTRIDDDYLEHIYRKLSEKGRMQFSTGEFMFLESEKGNKFDIDYWPYISSYLKCIECEMKIRLGDLIINNIPGIKVPLTLGSYSFVLKSYRNVMNRLLDRIIPDEIIKDFDYLINLRNKNTHDEVFTHDDFKSVRKLLIDNKLLEKIIEIRPLDKTILEKNDSSEHTLKQVKIRSKSTLSDLVNYKEMDHLEFDNNIVGINLLKHYTNEILNDSIIFDDEYLIDLHIDTSIDSDTFGNLAIMRAGQNIDILASYNYGGIQNFKDGINLLYCANFMKGNLYLPGVLKVKETNNQTYIIGDENIQKTRKQSYISIAKNLNNLELINLFYKYNNNVLSKLLYYIQESIVVQDIINKILASEEIWIFSNINEITNRYGLMKELLISLEKNIYIYSIVWKESIVKACLYFINFENLLYSDDEYLYPYVIIEVKDGEFIGIKFEKLMQSKMNNTIFEIREI